MESNVGDCSSEVINRLFSRYDRHEYAPISDFSVGIIAAKRDPKLANTMIDTFKARRNPSLHGAMLELWLFASLQNGGLELYDTKASHIETWPQCGCIEFNPNDTTFPIPESSIWLKPLQWNEGGYDAVYVDNYTRFVQVTRGNVHSFRIWCFYKLLSKFCYIFETKRLDICFVVPMDKVSTFKIGPVSGEGLLSQFGDDWVHGKEVDSARILVTTKFTTN